ILRKWNDLHGFAEAINDVDPVRHFGESCIAALIEYVLVTRIHGDDAIAMILHVFCREIARSIPLGRQADDRDRSRCAKDAPYAANVVYDRHLVNAHTPRRPYG